MSKITKKRFQKLAGILSESTYHRAMHDHLHKAVHECVATLLDKVAENEFEDDRYEMAEDLKDMIIQYFKRANLSEV